MNGGTRVVPIRYFGFAWRPDEFSRLVSAEQTNRDIAHHYNSPGLGLPLLAERVASCPGKVFYRPWQPFAATVGVAPRDRSGRPIAGDDGQ